MFPLLSILLYFLPVASQLTLPSPPYLPPNTTSGAVPSPSGKPNTQWSTLLGNLLFFYDAQRSGKISIENRVSWRNDSALSDGQDAGLDLSGGYFDAGDFVKCTYPLSFTLMSLCWGAMDFGAGYDSANQTAYLDSMLRWGLDWLMNAHPQPSTLYVQVADSQTDSSYWGGDRNIPGPRPSYQINDTSPGTDAAAQASAAFAACSLLYSHQSFNTSSSPPASLSNASYAQKLLSHAEQLYSFAVNASGGLHTYQTYVPQVGETYPSTSFGDELTIAALFLSLTNTSSTNTNFTLSPTALYNQAQGFWSEYSLQGQNGVFNWDDKTPALAVLFAQIASVRSDLGNGNLTAWKSEVERYFDAIVNNKGPGFLTEGGLLWYDGDSDDASLNPALNAAMLMARYAPLASSEDKTSAYQVAIVMYLVGWGITDDPEQNFAKSQLDYVLGNNPMSAPYVVGSNPNSPSNPHSAMASGGNDIGAINTSPPQEAYVLYGGVVGGPDRDDQFWDIRSDWPETEIALDYTAPMLSLAAYNVLTNPNDPFFTSLQAGEYEKRKPSGQPCDAAFNCMPGLGKGMSKGAKIAMGVVVGVVGLIIFALVLRWVWLCFALKR